MQTSTEKRFPFPSEPEKPRRAEDRPAVDAFDPYFPRRPIRSEPSESVRYSPFGLSGHNEGADRSAR